MYGEPLPPYDENEPTENWPDVLERIRTAQSALSAMACLLDGNPSSERWFGFMGRQALENALKGYLAALDMRYDREHCCQHLPAHLGVNPVREPRIQDFRFHLAHRAEWPVKARWGGLAAFYPASDYMEPRPNASDASHPVCEPVVLQGRKPHAIGFMTIHKAPCIRPPRGTAD